MSPTRQHGRCGGSARTTAGCSYWTNVVQPADIETVLAVALCGRVIATSRRHLDWSELGLAPLGLEVLDRQSSGVDLLMHLTHRHDEHAQAALQPAGTRQRAPMPARPVPASADPRPGMPLRGRNA